MICPATLPFCPEIFITTAQSNVLSGNGLSNSEDRLSRDFGKSLVRRVFFPFKAENLLDQGKHRLSSGFAV